MPDLLPQSAPARAAIVVSAEDGRVLGARAPTALAYPASLAKMMTLYLLFEAVESGRLGLSDRLTVSRAAAAQPPTKLGLKAGAKLPVKTAIQAIASLSANDVAVAVADRLAGSEAAFAELMTATARELGMARTRFTNATGLPDPEMVTTARDLALLARALVRDHPGLYRLVGGKGFSLGGRWRQGHNGFLGRLPGSDGIKSGFTCAAGYTLAASAVRDGRRLIGVVLGNPTRQDRDRGMARLLDGGFRRLDGGGPTLAALADDPAVRVASLSNDWIAERCFGTDRAPEIEVDSAAWAVQVGVELTPEKALKTARAAERALRKRLGRGHPFALVWPGRAPVRYRALITNLEEAEAVPTCLDLREREDHTACLVLNPATLAASLEAAERFERLQAAAGDQ
ncbi:D-alanyl-D-alanine carboxypeptidase family protein [Roseospirillum parvum]|uniref:D-alanyl-D-alanine carboxypeptidase family protein n=1 Tax=Roseospirillum parvum TaxID=83401 RepID=UPI00159FE88E|nr:D-alanyl-D-alanine carboxypeptidase family protein [Roseospirillum parvum]